MDYNQLVQELNNMGVTPPDVMRASLYYDYLVQARNFFHTELAKATPEGLGPGYVFVQNAVRDASVLNYLAEILDEFTAPAVENALWWEYQHGHGPNDNNPWTYDDYFNNRILDANDQQYKLNVARFRSDFPISTHAVKKLGENFCHNVERCCRRVYADRLDLKKWYSDVYRNLSFDSLLRLKSSGSDFHKGGGQVLILTFAISYRKENVNVLGEMKVVYKPGDLEADCLLMGDSDSVNRVIDDFMEASLAEIYNENVARFPFFEALPLPTYRILPCDYNSKHGATVPLKVADAYGYVEFLNNDLEWGAKEWYGYYPGASSDFVIFKTQSASTIIREFYQRSGAFCALATSFSITDIHIDNYRVKQYNPYAIDLELSLTTAVDDIQDTMLVKASFGALSASDSVEYRWEVRKRQVPGESYLERKQRPKPAANRLYRALAGKEKSLVKIDLIELLRGYHRAMRILRECQQSSAFDAWFTRVNKNVVVRFITFGTQDFQDTQKQIFFQPFEDHVGRKLAFDKQLELILLRKITFNYERYEDGDEPKFLAFQLNQAGVDLSNMDIPVYYYRVAPNQLNIVNSRGFRISIPDTIETLNGVKACRDRVGRDTYFAQQPVVYNVIKRQLEVLDNHDTYEKRVDLINESFLEALTARKTPEEITKIISFD